MQMTFRKIKDGFVQRKLAKALALLPDTRAINNKEIHSIGILTTDDLSSSLELTESFKEMIPGSRNIHVYSFRDFNKHDEKSYKHFSDQDFNWKSEIIDPSLESFLETSFDLLIGYFDEKHLYLELAVLKSRADFKAGFTNVNDQLFDLVVVEKSSEVKSFASEVNKYVHILKKGATSV